MFDFLGFLEFVFIFMREQIFYSHKVQSLRVSPNMAASRWYVELRSSLDLNQDDQRKCISKIFSLVIYVETVLSSKQLVPLINLSRTDRRHMLRDVSIRSDRTQT